MNNIQITKTKVTVDLDGFKTELIELAQRIKESMPSQVGITIIVLKKELGIKLTPLQFRELAKKLELNVSPNGYILIKDLLK